MLWHYWRARHLTFRNRDELEAYQQKRLAHFKRKVLSKSPYFQRYINQPLSNFPL